MSASLVGSEMCIRDRLFQGRRRDVLVHIVLAHRAQAGVDRLEGAEGCPVSYTHLTLPTICSV
eukprot:14727448-Alexandrium_andersonii.AAC.1